MAGLLGAAPALPHSLGAAYKLIVRPLGGTRLSRRGGYPAWGKSRLSGSPRLLEFLKPPGHHDAAEWGTPHPSVGPGRGGSRAPRGPVASYAQGQKLSGDGTGRTRRRGEKKSRQLEGRKAFRETFLAALEAEKAEEMREFQVRMREWPTARLAAEGYSLFSLIPSPRGSFFKRRIIQFVSSFSGSGLLPDHHVFSPGDMVLISERHPLDDDLVVEGVVLERARRFLLVVVDPGDTELFASRRKLRLDLAFNAITFQRASAAVGSFSDLSLADAEGRGGGEGAPGRGPSSGGPLGETMGSGRHAALTRRTRQDRERAEGRGRGREGPGGGGSRGGGGYAEGIQGPLGEAVAATWQLLLGPGSSVQVGLGQGEDATAEDSESTDRDDSYSSGSGPESELDNEESFYDRFKQGGRRRLGTRGQGPAELPLTTNIPPEYFDAAQVPRPSLANDPLDHNTSSDRSRLSPLPRYTTAGTPLDQPAAPTLLDRYSSSSSNRKTEGAATASLLLRAKEALTYSRKPPPWARGKRDSGEHRARARAALQALLKPPPVATYAPSTMATSAGGPTSAAQGRLASSSQGVRPGVVGRALPVLNGSQAAAVEASLERRLSLWQGPPGTGKTRTLVALVHTASVTLGLGRVLACADSNVAVDNMVEGLLEMGVNVVRIGQPVKVKESLRNATLEARLAQHPGVGRAAAVRGEAMALRTAARGENNAGRRTDKAKKASALWRMAEDIEAGAVLDILKSADVVASTCVGAGDPYIQTLLQHFDKQRGRVTSRSPAASAPSAPAAKDTAAFAICVIDEAAQATLPVSLIPLLVAGAHCTVLAGDPQQLPPTVLSREAQQVGLGRSLYAHLQDAGMVPMLLDTQYRMHPAIATFPSLRFYGGRLVSFPKPADRPAPQGFGWPDPGRPLAFLDCAGGREESTGESASWMNRAEAQQVVSVVKGLLSTGDLRGGAGDIGVITPYSGQAKLLSDMFFRTGGGGLEALEIKTVDGFQGREKEVIVVSTVRCNPKGILGFVADYQRLNVSVTRAKRGLIVVGDGRTLSRDPHWAAWIQQAPRMVCSRETSVL